MNERRQEEERIRGMFHHARNDYGNRMLADFIREEIRRGAHLLASPKDDADRLLRAYQTNPASMLRLARRYGWRGKRPALPRGVKTGRRKSAEMALASYYARYPGGPLYVVLPNCRRTA